MLLAQVAFSLNSTVHIGTKSSPMECLFGFTPSLPVDVAFNDVKVPATVDFVQRSLDVHTAV